MFVHPSKERERQELGSHMMHLDRQESINGVGVTIYKAVSSDQNVDVIFHLAITDRHTEVVRHQRGHMNLSKLKLRTECMHAP
jgi:hypothetical protein